jgi:hypothetical protein
MMALFTASFYESWYALSLAVAALSVTIAAMLIVLSRMFSLKQLEQAAKTEFVFAVSTVLIVIASTALITIGEPAIVKADKIIYLSTMGCAENSALVDALKISGQQDTLIDITQLYMKPPLDCATATMNSLYWLSIPLDACSSVYTEIFMSELATGYGCKPLSERLKNSGSIIAFYIYISYLLMYFLKFIKYYAGFFFTIGVVMRAFPPTRGAGAYLMAAAIGFYFVFPFAYSIFATLSLPHTWQTTTLVAANSQQIGLEGGMPSCTADAIRGHFEEACSLPDLGDMDENNGCGTGDWRSMQSAIVSIKANKQQIWNFLNPAAGSINNILSTLLNSVCIVPLVALIVTMTFVLNSTNLFGGNIPEIGRGLVKLI